MLTLCLKQVHKKFEAQDTIHKLCMGERKTLTGVRDPSRLTHLILLFFCCRHYYIFAFHIFHVPVPLASNEL